MTREMFCDEFHLVDLRLFDNCIKVVKGCDHVFNFAADMGATYFGSPDPDYRVLTDFLLTQVAWDSFSPITVSSSTTTR